MVGVWVCSVAAVLVGAADVLRSRLCACRPADGDASAEGQPEVPSVPVYPINGCRGLRTLATCSFGKSHKSRMEAFPCCTVKRRRKG